jgi:8-oxo-dGTP pyrophosphatase MutT (NUDIX family)
VNVTPPHDYGESVLFAFVQNGQILCEWRNWRGRMQYSIPGGKVDPADRQQTHYQHAALIRETWEELRVTPKHFTRIGEIWYKEAEWLFHVYMVSDWEGEIPPKVLDNQRPLGWIDPKDLEDNPAMIGISALVRSTLSEQHGFSE